MSTRSKDLGPVTAYAYAVAGGYSGTEEEFGELLGDIAEDLSNIENLSVTVTTLPAGSAATASYSNGVLSLGIPKGDKGDQGDEGDQGPQGVSIGSVVKTGTSGNVDTYTTYSDESTPTVLGTFTVTNSNVSSVNEHTGTVVLDAGDLEFDDSEAYSGGTVGAEVSQLKSQIGDLSAVNYNVKGVTSDSGLVPFFAKTGDVITISTSDGSTFPSTDQLRFYDKDGAYIGYWATSYSYGSSRTFTYSAAKTAYYIGITKVSATVYSYNVINSSNIYYQPIAKNSSDIANLQDTAAKKSIINRFNKATITEGKYVSPSDGSLVNASGFFASDFIYIGDLDTVIVSYTHLFSWYNANKVFLSSPSSTGSVNNDLAVTPPSGAVYLRFSTWDEYLGKAQIGKGVTRAHYVPYGDYILPGFVNVGEEIIVDANGSGDYTSLTLALKEHLDDGVKIKVLPGTYDIESEYEAIWGADAVANMADSDSATFGGFQYGIIIRNREIEFMSGSHVVCDWTGHTVDATHRFSVIRVDYNVKIIGLDLTATGTFYAIHDDYGVSAPYTNEYVNCKVVGTNLSNGNCIGGGCRAYSHHILRDCYFSSNNNSVNTVRYHNTNELGAEPIIHISNCYFSRSFQARWYGEQTTKMRVYVNNCEAQFITKAAETESSITDNVELYKWCNTETNPVT